MLLNNFSPMAALVLCAALYFPRRVATIVPFVALLVSDLVLNAHYMRPMLTWDIVPRYVALALVAGIGFALRGRVKAPGVFGASFAGSVLFYLITNTGSWIAEPGYAKSAVGWMQAMTVGLPSHSATPTWMFYRNTFISDMVFTGLFLLCLKLGRPKTAPEAVPAREELAPW